MLDGGNLSGRTAPTGRNVNYYPNVVSNFVQFGSLARSARSARSAWFDSGVWDHLMRCFGSGCCH